MAYQIQYNGGEAEPRKPNFLRILLCLIVLYTSIRLMPTVISQAKKAMPVFTRTISITDEFAEQIRQGTPVAEAVGNFWHELFNTQVH